MSSDDTILIFDVETTGINPNSDQVIELAVQKGLGPESWKKSRRFRPTIPIPAEATAVHGITDADVADCPAFRTVVGAVRKFFTDAEVIVGYNVTFDIQMLNAEFERAGVAPLDLKGKQIIDPHRLWSRCEPRRLEEAVKRFAKREHDGAHSALADVSATGEVLTGMLEQFELGGKSWTELADLIDPERKTRIGGTEHLVWRNETVVFGFGKHRGRAILEVIKEDENYSRWIVGKDFPAHVKSIVSRAVELEDAEFHAWIQTEYGCASVVEQ